MSIEMNYTDEQKKLNELESILLSEIHKFCVDNEIAPIYTVGIFENMASRIEYRKHYMSTR